MIFVSACNRQVCYRSVPRNRCVPDCRPMPSSCSQNLLLCSSRYTCAIAASISFKHQPCNRLYVKVAIAAATIFAFRFSAGHNIVSQ